MNKVVSDTCIVFFAPNCRSRWPKKKQGLKNHSSLFCTVNISLENDPVFSLKATVATLYPTLLMNWPVFLWIFLLLLCHTTKLPRALCNVHPLVLVKNVPSNKFFSSICKSLHWTENWKKSESIKLSWGDKNQILKHSFWNGGRWGKRTILGGG